MQGLRRHNARHALCTHDAVTAPTRHSVACWGQGCKASGGTVESITRARPWCGSVRISCSPARQERIRERSLPSSREPSLKSMSVVRKTPPLTLLPLRQPMAMTETRTTRWLANLSAGRPSLTQACAQSRPRSSCSAFGGELPGAREPHILSMRRSVLRSPPMTLPPTGIV